MEKESFCLADGLLRLSGQSFGKHHPQLHFNRPNSEQTWRIFAAIVFGIQ